MQSFAVSTAASRDTAAATAAAIGSSSPDSAATAASQATAPAFSTRHSISAQMCLIAWNEPMGFPNCSRIFAYSTAVRRLHAAIPAASAAPQHRREIGNRSWGNVIEDSVGVDCHSVERDSCQWSRLVDGVDRFVGHAFAVTVDESPDDTRTVGSGHHARRNEYRYTRICTPGVTSFAMKLDAAGRIRRCRNWTFVQYDGTRQRTVGERFGPPFGSGRRTTPHHQSGQRSRENRTRHEFDCRLLEHGREIDDFGSGSAYRFRNGDRKDPERRELGPFLPPRNCWSTAYHVHRRGRARPGLYRFLDRPLFIGRGDCHNWFPPLDK